jgi:hypothetical protein
MLFDNAKSIRVKWHLSSGHGSMEKEREGFVGILGHYYQHRYTAMLCGCVFDERQEDLIGQSIIQAW